jgi:O-glycosyl hydrolase
MDTDEDNSVQNTNRFGIKYTAEQFTETKLLKILNDVAAPHFLYQDILSWASPEAKVTNIHSILNDLSDLPK